MVICIYSVGKMGTINLVVHTFFYIINNINGYEIVYQLYMYITNDKYTGTKIDCNICKFTHYKDTVRFLIDNFAN